MVPLIELKKGQKARIKSFKEGFSSSVLVQMGCVPGEMVMLSKTAPLGCPFAIIVAGYELSLRKEEASSVFIELVA